MSKGGKGRFFLKFTHQDSVTGDHIVGKSVQRLTRLMKDKVGYIYHIVNRAQADRLQPRLQPYRRVPNGYVVDDKGGITVAFFRGKNLHSYRVLKGLVRNFYLGVGIFQRLPDDS